MLLVIEQRAQRRLRRMPVKVRITMLERLKAVAGDSFAEHRNVKQLRAS
jgi:hypothetical protein